MCCVDQPRAGEGVYAVSLAVTEKAAVTSVRPLLGGWGVVGALWPLLGAGPPLGGVRVVRMWVPLSRRGLS